MVWLRPDRLLLGIKVHIPRNARHILPRIVRSEQALVKLSLNYMGSNDSIGLWDTDSHRLVSFVHSEIGVRSPGPWIRHYNHLFHNACDDHNKYTSDQTHS